MRVFFFFFFYIYAVISLDIFPVFFHFPSSKIQRERRRYTRLCGESWVKFDADKSSDCFLFFFHFGQFLFSRYSRTPPPWNEKKKKKITKKGTKEKNLMGGCQFVSFSLFFFLLKYRKHNTSIRTKLLRLDINNLTPADGALHYR